MCAVEAERVRVILYTIIKVMGKCEPHFGHCMIFEFHDRHNLTGLIVALLMYFGAHIISHQHQLFSVNEGQN